MEGGCAIDASVSAAHVVSERRTWERELARCSGLKGAQGGTNLKSPGGVVVSPGQRGLQACTDASAARIRNWSPQAWRGLYAGPGGQKCGSGARATGGCLFSARFGYRSSGIEVEVGVEFCSFSKRRRQPERHGQRWSRNVKGAGSATGDMLYNIEPATIVEQRDPGGQRRFVAGVHALLTHLAPCNRSVNKGNGRNKDAQGCGGRDVCVRRSSTHQFDSGLVWDRLLVRSGAGAILGLSKRAALTTDYRR